MRRNSVTRSFVVALALAASLTAQPGRYRDRVFSQVEVQRDIPYGAAFNASALAEETLLLDLYMPVGDDELVRPAVVLAHEGGFLAGDKTQEEIVRLAEDFASRGYVAISINYRLGKAPVTPRIVADASHDMLAAIRWLRSQAVSLRVDAERIACMGASAGGIMSLTGQYDDDLGEGDSGNPGFRSDARAVVELWAAFDNSEFDFGEPSLAIIHGTDDQVVPFQFALNLAFVSTVAGIYSELLQIKDGPHSAWPQYFDEVHIQTLGFLYNELGLSALVGLAVRPDSSRSGAIILDTFGRGGDSVLLFLGAQFRQAEIPGFGTLCLGPLDLVTTIDTASLPDGARLTETSFELDLPSGLAGLTLHWQAFQLAPDGRGILTNCVKTRL